MSSQLSLIFKSSNHAKAASRILTATVGLTNNHHCKTMMNPLIGNHSRITTMTSNRPVAEFPPPRKSQKKSPRSRESLHCSHRNHPSNNKSTSVALSNLNFDDPQLAFRGVESAALFRHALVLTLLRIPGLANNCSRLANICYTLIGKKATAALFRVTLFDHFCGGTNLDELMKTSERLSKMGVGAIVDYAAECEDVSTFSQPDLEAWFDKNVKLTNDAVAAAAKMREIFAKGGSSQFAFVAVKVTAIASPTLLRKFNSALNFTHNLFAIASGQREWGDDKSATVNSRDHETLMDRTIHKDQFIAAVKTVWPTVTDIEEKFDQATKLSPISMSSRENRPEVSYFQWQRFWTPEQLSSLPAPIVPSNVVMTEMLRSEWLTRNDVQEINYVTQRMEAIADVAKKMNVKLLVDAEQTCLQNSIDFFAIQQMEKQNKIKEEIKPGTATVYNTYQMYLKSGIGRLTADAKRAELLGYTNAVKLVRGAYMFQERRLAEEGSYASPVHDTLEETHQSYNKAVEFMVKQLEGSEMLCGTHNENSAKYAAALMAKQFPNKHPGSLPMSFGQLLGMCDHVTFVLRQAGCQVYKYVPYGPVDLVMPYLIRRAEENSSVFGGSARESRLIWTELRRRLLKRFRNDTTMTLKTSGGLDSACP